jgi:hypothetical protein
MRLRVSFRGQSRAKFAAPKPVYRSRNTKP